MYYMRHISSADYCTTLPLVYKPQRVCLWGIKINHLRASKIEHAKCTGVEWRLERQLPPN